MNAGSFFSVEDLVSFYKIALLVCMGVELFNLS